MGEISFEFELGFTAPQHGIDYMAPFRKKLVGSTSHLHRDKTMGYGSNNLIPAGESEMQKLQIIAEKGLVRYSNDSESLIVNI